ncbi:MAG: FtsX-like permease family protein [Acidimicrobiales bacterium]
MAARHAMARWAWRMFRREWRQQTLVLVLLTVSVAAAVFGASAAYNVAPSRDAEFGSAEQRIVLRVTAPNTLEADLTSLRSSFGAIDVIGHQEVAVPGSVEKLDLRTQDPRGPYGAPMLALRQGRFPAQADEIALTDGAAQSLNTHVGASLSLEGVDRTVVGLVENPGKFSDEFALLAPSADAPRQSVTVLLGSGSTDLSRVRLPSGANFFGQRRGADENVTAAVLVLVLSTLVLLLICLVAAAAFAVIAQRRLRQLGMLAAIGATARHLRLVVLINGVVVGVIAAVVGTGMALVGWIALSPQLESAAGHRIDRFDVPWWLLGAGVLLAVATATAAAWWPARSSARIPVTEALSARPPRPKPVHRSAIATVILLGAGFAALTAGVNTAKDKVNPLLLIGGTVAIVIGLLFVSPLAIRALATTAKRLPIAVRLALRDLARYQARSGAALAAISLGLGIAAATVVIAAAAQHSAGEGNLSDRQVLVRLGNDQEPVIPEHSPTELQQFQSDVDGFAATLNGATVIALDAAINPSAHESRQGQSLMAEAMLGRRVGEDTYRDEGILYVATPGLLDHLGLDRSLVNSQADVLTSHTGELSLIGPIKQGGATKAAPRLQTISAPKYSSAPTSFITPAGLTRAGLQPARSGWLVETTRPFTTEQLAAARTMAANAGLTVESRDHQGGLATIRAGATAAGILLALCILAMTVGLIRSEAGRDLRTLTAAGATSMTRRTLTAATAGALALLGAGLGIAGAYIALIAGYIHDLKPLANVPVLHFSITIVGLPVLAAIAGWLLAGAEPPAIARPAMD